MKPRTLRRRLRIEALVLLGAAWLAVRLVPAARLLDRAARPPRHPRRFYDPELPAFIARIVEAVGNNSWIRFACLPRAMATQAMLRRRGVASRLCLGVAREDARMAAHAWVEIDRTALADAPGERFARVAEFG
jgi:hypothetical protein